MKQFLSIIFALLLISAVQAQTPIIKGKVTGANDNEALPGVSVVTKVRSVVRRQTLTVLSKSKYLMLRPFSFLASLDINP